VESESRASADSALLRQRRQPVAGQTAQLCYSVQNARSGAHAPIESAWRAAGWLLHVLARAHHPLHADGRRLRWHRGRPFVHLPVQSLPAARPAELQYAVGRTEVPTIPVHPGAMRPPVPAAPRRHRPATARRPASRPLRGDLLGPRRRPARSTPCPRRTSTVKTLECSGPCSWTVE